MALKLYDLILIYIFIAIPGFVREYSHQSEDHQIIRDKSHSPTKLRKKDDRFLFDPKINSDAELCKNIVEAGAYKQPNNTSKIDNNLEKYIVRDKYLVMEA